MDPESRGVRRLSTVLSGSLVFEFDGAERALRAGGAVRFERSAGEIRALRLDDDHLVLDFRGRVHGMSTGSDENPRDLMPSLLEWLRARKGLALLWGTTLYLLGVTLAALRWWRSPA